MANLSNFVEPLASTQVARFIQESSWAYPASEVVHLMGLALVVGPALMWDLRLLGLSQKIPVSFISRHLLPWTGVGMLLAISSGFLLFLSDPVTLAASTPFRIKLLLIVVAGLNAGYFHLRVGKTVDQWNQFLPAPTAAKIAALISIMVWTAVVTAGRLIAYL